MQRRILLDKPITYLALNGYRMNYNCILIEYSPNGNMQLTMTVNEGCAPYNDITITTDSLTVPDNLVAIRPNIPSVKILIPELEARNILIPNTSKPSIFSFGVHFPLYSVQIPLNNKRQQEYEEVLAQV